MKVDMPLNKETKPSVKNDGWLVVLFYSVSAHFGSFNVELSQFDENLHVSRSSDLQICINIVNVKCSISNKYVV